MIVSKTPLRMSFVGGGSDIPTFYQTSVKGHIGEFIYGEINNTPILCAKEDFTIMKDIHLMKLGP